MNIQEFRNFMEGEWFCKERVQRFHFDGQNILVFRGSENVKELTIDSKFHEVDDSLGKVVRISINFLGLNNVPFKAIPPHKFEVIDERANNETVIFERQK